MEFSDVIKNRYSCEKFSSEQIGKDKLDAILEAGRVAPTAKNLQEQHIYVVQSESGLETIDKLTPCRYNAPTVLIVAFNKNFKNGIRKDCILIKDLCCEYCLNGMIEELLEIDGIESAYTDFDYNNKFNVNIFITYNDEIIGKEKINELKEQFNSY